MFDSEKCMGISHANNFSHPDYQSMHFLHVILHEYIAHKKRQNQDANNFIFGHKHTHLKAVLP